MFTKTIIGIFSIIGLLSTVGMGVVTTSTVTSYISIPIGDTNCDTSGFYIDKSTHFCIAGLHIPNGATITKLTLYWRDASEYSGILRLYRYAFDEVSQIEATVISNGMEDIISSSTVATSIIVDNSQYAYWVSFTIPALPEGQNVYLYGAIVEYTIPFYTSYLSLLQNR